MQVDAAHDGGLGIGGPASTSTDRDAAQGRDRDASRGPIVGRVERRGGRVVAPRGSWIVLRVADIDEAIGMINDNPYGNGTAIFTANGAAARKFQNEVQVGMIGVNIPIPVPMAFYSFGGWKNSLFGDLHIYGPEGIQFYTRGKVVTSRWPDPATSRVDLGFPQTH